MVLESIGWISNLLFAVSAIPQAYKSYKDGHARGVAFGTVITWFFGEIGILIYFVGSYGWDGAMILNYACNSFFVGVILRYRIFPRYVVERED